MLRQPDVIDFKAIYVQLQAEHGPQNWWPADDEFEIMVGALLVQRTAWRNAASAIAKLKRARLLNPDRLQQEPLASIQNHVRSAGFYRSKAKRLQALSAFVVEHGGVAALQSRPTDELRLLLLSVEGIGPETADAILLYAFDRPVVVVDEYLRRLTHRLSASPGRHGDDVIRQWVALRITTARELNEWHALVIAHGKQHCGKTPACRNCGIQTLCKTGKAPSDAELGQGVRHFAQNS